MEVVEISREERDVYLIPQNFVDTGTILGGTVKLRNAVEAAVLAVGSAVPLFYLPLAFNIRLMIVIAVSVPLGVFGVVGIGGDSLTQFVAHWFRFMKRRRIVTPTPQGNLEANRHRHLRFISKRYYTYIYNPPAGYAWQVVALVGEEIAGGTEIPDVPSVPEPKYYSAAWTAPAQSASGSFDLTFTVNTDKYQLNTLEKVDGAVITVTPSRTGGSVDGGSWQMTPAGAQTITTSCHTQDDSFHVNGGDGSATWTVHYEVSKTSTSTLSGQEGPFTSQAEADAAAETAKNAAIGQLQNEAQGMVDAAIASARAQLANITFSYDEITIPHGFDSTPGALGSHQTITVPANSSNDYQMKNDEWSVKVSIDKIDSETKQRIKSDTEFKIFEWDAVRQCYIPAGGYNQYKVERQADGTYKVINHSDYAGGSDDLFYTQRNEGKLASKIAIFSVIRRALSFSRPVGQASRNHSFLYRRSRRITSSPVLREVVRRRNFSGSKPGTWFKDATVALVVYSIGS